ncbi:hypothetical protein ACFXPA_29140 [Amycolatopsis sp. NPDC059090]
MTDQTGTREDERGAISQETCPRGPLAAAGIEQPYRRLRNS